MELDNERPKRCKFCLRHFKYDHSLVMHLKENHMLQILRYKRLKPCKTFKLHRSSVIVSNPHFRKWKFWKNVLENLSNKSDGALKYKLAIRFCSPHSQKNVTPFLANHRQCSTESYVWPGNIQFSTQRSQEKEGAPGIEGNSKCFWRSPFSHYSEWGSKSTWLVLRHRYNRGNYFM